MKIKAKALGYGGAQKQVSVAGPSSHVKTNKNPVFIIWVNEGVDPESILVLSKVEASKKKRSIPLVKVSAFAGYGASGKSMSGKYHVLLDIERVEDGVYKLTPATPLETQSEYAFYHPQNTAADQMKLYLFATK